MLGHSRVKKHTAVTHEDDTLEKAVSITHIYQYCTSPACYDATDTHLQNMYIHLTSSLPLPETSEVNMAVPLNLIFTGKCDEHRAKELSIYLTGPGHTDDGKKMEGEDTGRFCTSNGNACGEQRQ